MMFRLQLDLLFLHLSLQVIGKILLLARARHEPRRIREHIVHLLKWHLLCLWQQRIEEERICEIANHKDEIVSVLDMFHRNGSDLSNHRVKRKRDTSRDGNTLRSSASIKDLGGNDPRKRTAGAGEGEVV